MEKNVRLQTSNWKKRPLTSKQLAYARQDVEYLLQLYDTLHTKLQNCGNYEFYTNTIEQLQKKRKPKSIIENAWKKLGFMYNEQAGDNFLLRELAKWREIKAIETNIARSNIVKNEVLQSLAKLKPKTMMELKKLYQNDRKILNIKKEYKHELVSVIRDFNEAKVTLSQETIYNRFVNSNTLSS